MRVKWLGAVVFSGLLVLGACGGGGGDDDGGGGDNGGGGAAEAGKKVFEGTCQSCHGPDGKGVEGTGKNLVDSTFVAENTEQQLVDFVKVGREANDPANTMGIQMPARGGNPALTDEDLANAVAYIKSINQAG